MKKIIKKVLILSLLLFAFSYLVIYFTGRTYVADFKLTNNNYKFTIENDTGKIKVLDKKITKDNFSVKVKAIKKGKVYLNIDYDDTQDLKVLYIHKNLVITENSFFGKSTCIFLIPISFVIISLYTLYLLIKRYKYHKNNNLFQYKNIVYLGIIIFLTFFVIRACFTIFRCKGLYEIVSNITTSLSFFSMLLFPIFTITFILVTISNINLIFKEGKSLKNLLGLFLGSFLIILTFLPNYIYGYLMKSQKFNVFNLNGPGPYIYEFIETFIYLVVAYLECVLIATIIIAITSIRKKVAFDKDYMIILGCKIRDDGTLPPLLKGRVDKALEFRNLQLSYTGKDLIFIPSGGQGRDEKMTEAEAIKNYLLENGINKKNILVENKSKNTYENIKFSSRLIKNKNAKICFSTTNYHVLRAGLIATQLGLNVDGIGSKIKSYFWINAFIREFIGTLYSERKKHLLFFLIIIIMIIIMIAITYIENNVVI